MYTLLIVALLLALFFDTAAATSPVTMDPTLSTEFTYPDPEGILDAFCEICGISINCMHAVATNPLQSLPIFYTEELFYQHPEWPQNFPVVEFPPELPPSIPYLTDAARQPLFINAIHQLDENATTVQPSTIQYHVEDIYTPGDRLQAASQPRRQLQKRQSPRPGGFPCPFEGCVKTFDRACDVNRHQKTHLGRSKRPHKCSKCEEGFLYPKDLVRHQSKHTSAQGTLYCNVPGCTSEGFSRRDNLLRHRKKQHPTITASP